MDNYSPECISPNGLLAVEEVARTYTQLIFGAGYLPVGATAQRMGNEHC